MSDETYEHWYDYGPGSEASNRRTRETLKHAQDHDPGITCPACAEKDKDNQAAMRRVALQAERINKLSAEIARLRALVEVGREMAEWIMKNPTPATIHLAVKMLDG